MELSEWGSSMVSSLPLPLSGATSDPVAEQAPRLVIRLLGGMAIEVAGKAHDEATWHRAHARRLLQLVGSTPKLQESRDAVLSVLWPDSDEPRARNRLHHTVHLIRKSLEALPLSVRPQWEVTSAKVSLALPPHAAVDVQRFMQTLEADAHDDPTRLAHIDQALGWYRGELAAEWADTGAIATRRAWLARRHEEILDEAATLSVELGQLDRAAKYAARRAQLLVTDIEAHCTYIDLLVQLGRADAALGHCRDIRRAFETDGDTVPLRLDEMARAIQQRVNQSPARAAATSERRLEQDGFDLDALPPRRPLLGFEGVLAVASQCLLDPHCRLVSLVGPPGCGKTTLAVELAHGAHSRLTHGVLWIDCHGIEATAEALVSRIGAGLGAARTGVADNHGDALAAVLREMRTRECLVVLDGFEFGAPMAPALAGLLGAGHDVRWLVTAWSSIDLPHEKSVSVDCAALLLGGTGERRVSPAAEMVASMGTHAWQLGDKRIRKAIDAIAASVGGLPRLLQTAARTLESIWPNELLAKLERDPAALIRSGGTDTACDGVELVRWLRWAPPQARELLAFAGECSGWLTRLDLALLLDGQAPCDIDALIDHCVSHHYLQRRVRHDHHESWSEFAVPRYARAALLLCEDAPTVPELHAHFERWLAGVPGRPSLPTVRSRCGRSDTEWFDDRIEDFDALVRRWHAQGRIADIAMLCAKQPACWSTSAHSARTLAWLQLLGERMEGLDDALAAGLLVKRARLRARLGQIHAAFGDASRALGRADAASDESARREAVKLIERYGKARPEVLMWPSSISERGVDAGESLLRIARLAVRHGEPQRAMQLCNEAGVVLAYFGLVRGVLKAHQYRARIAYSMGDTALSLRCIGQCETTARTIGEPAGMASIELMRANVLLADLQFARAIELATSVLSRPQIAGSPALVARGLLTLGWAYYATGALPVVRSMTDGLIEQARAIGEPDACASAELLAMLVLVRQGEPQAALRHARAMLEFVACRPQLPDTQGDLVNAIDIALHLGQSALAQPLIHALRSFGDRAGHRLRPWTRQRLDGFDHSLAEVAVGDVPLRASDMRDENSLQRVLHLLIAA